MEEPSSLDPHNPPPIYHDHLQDDDSDPLSIPPLDDADAMLNGELSFPDECVASDFHFEEYLDFNLDDLDFTEDVLMDPGPEPNSASSDEPCFDQNHVIPDLDPTVSDPVLNSVSGLHVVEGLDSGFSDQGFKVVVEVSNSEVNLDPVTPRVSHESTLVNSDLDSSIHVPRDESTNPGSNGSICSNDQPAAGRELNHKLNHNLSPESVSCEQLSSQGSGDSNSGFSDNPRSPDSCQSARDVSSNVSKNSPLKYSTENCEVKVEDAACKFIPKRKKDQQEDGHSDSRTSKSRKSSSHIVDANLNGTFTPGTGDDEDKKKARLMRNRESAQLSRQRKKQYVEELEDKVRSMHSTITDLNSKISYMMAENATLRQQLTGGGVCGPPPPGMYPMAPMGYPWMPCPPYVMKPQGSQVPLVPIPRLKPTQQPVIAPKVSSRKTEKSESKKGGESGKTKKVASISFLGLLFFFLLFGGLVPMISVRYGGGIGETLSFSSRFSDTHKGRILMVDGGLNRSGHERGRVYSDGNYSHKSGVLKGERNRLPKDHLLKSSEAGNDGSASGANSSEPLVASLYVPRNDKMVQIDGNLIIHSVLASERATTSSVEEGLQEKQGKDTSLAIARNYVPAYHVSARQRALGSGVGDKSKLPANDGRLQQWFQEGLAGPLLSSGMCTEVFQFNVSPTPGSIVPATPVPNKTTAETRQNTTTGRNKSARNRRILHGRPISLNNAHALNITEQHSMDPNAENVRGLEGNKSSSMVVSVLMDPREAGDGEGETVMRSKSHSRIFVVVLIDSIRYVTYSCMLPLMGSGHHLVTA